MAPAEVDVALCSVDFGFDSPVGARGVQFRRQSQGWRRWGRRQSPTTVIQAATSLRAMGRPEMDRPSTGRQPMDRLPMSVGRTGGRRCAARPGGPPPSMLAATVIDQRRGGIFELLWTAPANERLPVNGYQVRYAKVPITAANFDDTTVATAIPYTGTPSAPGATDGLRAKLYIENNYYFAVVGRTRKNGHVGTLMTTETAVAAHFNVAVVNSPTGTNQQFGAALDG